MFHNYTAETISTNPRDNHVSTADTIAKMSQLVGSNLNLPIVSATAAEILAKIGKATPTELDIISGTYWWVKRHLKFVEDNQILQQQLGVMDLEQGKELLLAPEFVLSLTPNAIGDCDDFSTLLATLLVQNGITNVFFCTIAADAYEPDNYSHVYVKVILQDGRCMALDASHGMYPGWETKNIFKSTDWSITGTIYHAGEGLLAIL